MKKIVFITWALEVGGAERFLVKLVQNIPQDRYSIQVVCVTRKGVWAEELETRGINVISMDKRVGIDIGVLFRLVYYLKKEKPDIVNTSIWTADLWGRMAAILAGVRHIIVTEQNVDIWKRWYHKIIDQILFKWTDYVLCVSDDVATFYHDNFGIPYSKLRMIPNAVDLDLFDKCITNSNFHVSLGINEKDFIFVCPARLHPQKAHHILIQAVYELFLNGHRGFKVLLIGEGERKQELQQLVVAKGLEEIVLFLGLRQDVPDILLQADAFVLSSDYEGLSLAVLEGMAARLPIIATRVGGNAQLVENGVSGYLVPPQDFLAFSNAMLMVLQDKNKAEAMGINGRSLVEKKYQIKIVASQVLKLFEEL